MTMMFALHNGVRVVNVIDHTAKPITDQQYLDAVGHDTLIYEAATQEEIQATYFYGLAGAGETVFTDAITTTKARIERTAAALAVSLNKGLTGTEIKAGEAVIGKPKKAGDLAVMDARFPLTDGQSITVIFHSPSNDPTKITEQDMLVAFRFLLNKRDVTHVVAPSSGRDISLKQTCLSLANLAERNSDKFKAKQDENKAKEEELAALEGDTDQQVQQAEQLAQQLDTLEQAQGGADAEIAKVSGQLEKQIQRNEELRGKLAGLQAAKKPTPDPEPTPDPAKKDDEFKGVLVNLQNQPKAGDKLGGAVKVEKATDKVIDVTRVIGGNFPESSRYTWDGTGYKRKGQYLLTNGATIPVEQVNPITVKAGELPEDGIRKIKEELNMFGRFTLTNGAVITRRYHDKAGELEGYITIVEKDGTVYRLDSTSSQGGAMGDATAKLYKAYKDGKAAKYRLDDDNTERSAEVIKNAFSGFVNGSIAPKWYTRFDVLDGKPMMTVDTPAIGEEGHDGYYIFANLDENGAPSGSFRLAYGDGGPITGATDLRDWEEAKAIMLAEYQKDVEKANKPEPEPTPELVEPEPTPDPVEPEPAPTDEAKPLHWYGLRQRPYSVGAQPAGAGAFISNALVDSDPRVAELIKDRDPTDWRHGMLGYAEPLTEKEISGYELVDMTAPVWTPASRAAKLAELLETVGMMVESGTPDDEIWGDLFVPRGSLVASNNAFYVDDKYESGQLTQALQEAGYSGSIKAMVNSVIDKIRAEQPEPEPTPDPVPEPTPEPEISNQWGETNPAILAVLEKLEDLRQNEGDYVLYGDRLDVLADELQQADAGAMERYEPYLIEVANRLTQLMEEAE